VSGIWTINTCGASTDFDTVLYIKQGGCNGPQQNCSDDFCGAGSTIMTNVTAGSPYTIVVDGYNGDFGNFELHVIPPGGSPSAAFVDGAVG